MTDKVTNNHTLDLKKTLNIDNFQDDNHKNNTVSLFNEYNSFFTNNINREINAYSVVFSLYSIFNLLSQVPFFILSNLSLFFIGMYMVLYNNVSQQLGKKMITFLGSIYLGCVIRPFFWNNWSFWCFNVLIIPISVGLFIMGNKRYESKQHKDLLEMKYELLLIAPLHSYVYLEDRYNLTQCASKVYKFCLNYVKKYSTSDVIRDELKDRGVDELYESENEKNTDTDQSNQDTTNDSATVEESQSHDNTESGSANKKDD